MTTPDDHTVISPRHPHVDKTVLASRRADRATAAHTHDDTENTVISGRRTAAVPAPTEQPTGRKAYSPDAASLATPYPPRAADPVIATRTSDGPGRV